MQQSALLLYSRVALLLLLFVLLLWQVYLASFHKAHQTLRFYANSLIAFHNNHNSKNKIIQINGMHCMCVARNNKTTNSTEQEHISFRNPDTRPSQLHIMSGIIWDLFSVFCLIFFFFCRYPGYTVSPATQSNLLTNEPTDFSR